MKGKTFLVLDVSWLCWRAFHSIGRKLSFNGVGTGVIFGLLRDIESLQEIHQTKRLIFCFDRGRSIRVREFAGYKHKRTGDTVTPEERKARQEVYRQMTLLRKDYLPGLGFANVFHQYGYEADDLIASVSSTIAKQKGKVIIVGRDKDLYQLLSPRVSLYIPSTQTTMTYEAFVEEHGINPTQWVDVKAMAGCNSDQIPGIDGIGEKTAAKYLRGQLKADSKAFQAIVAGDAIWKRNRSLVELPYPGTKEFEIREDNTSDKKWLKLAKKLGMKSLMGGKMPDPTKEYRRNITIKRRSFF